MVQPQVSMSQSILATTTTAQGQNNATGQPPWFSPKSRCRNLSWRQRQPHKDKTMQQDSLHGSAPSLDVAIYPGDNDNRTRTKQCNRTASMVQPQVSMSQSILATTTTAQGQNNATGQPPWF